jgi:hypothetical protein
MKATGRTSDRFVRSVRQDDATNRGNATSAARRTEKSLLFLRRSLAGADARSPKDVRVSETAYATLGASEHFVASAGPPAASHRFRRIFHWTASVPLERVPAERTFGEEVPIMTTVLPLLSLLSIVPQAVAHDEGGCHEPQERVALHASTMFGGPTQDGALVYVRNVSQHTVRLADRRIVDEDGQRLPLNVDTCGYLLAPQETCTFEAEIVPGRAYAATLVLKDASGMDVRAQLELRDSFSTGVGPLARDNLR